MTKEIARRLVGNVWRTEVAEENGGGGATPGAAIVRGPFSFAFDTAGLTAGVAVYTPAVGELLFDVWFDVTTVFNGTTPHADVGTFVGATTGLWKFSGQINGFSLLTTGREDVGTGLFTLAGPFIGGADQISEVFAVAGDQGLPILPGRFTATNPLKLVVSQDGAVGGAAVGGTAGAASLYIVTATPAAL